MVTRIFLWLALPGLSYGELGFGQAEHDRSGVFVGRSCPAGSGSIRRVMRTIPILILLALGGTLAGCGPSSSSSSSAAGSAEAPVAGAKAAPPLSDAPVLAAVGAGKANAAWRVPIQGMSCDGCASGIQSELLRTPGVVAAAVGFAEGLAVVAVDTNTLSFATLAKVVEEAGYKASPPQP